MAGGGGKSILVVGDSHSRDVFTALSINNPDPSGLVIGHAHFDEWCFIKKNYQPTLARRILGLDQEHLRETCADDQKQMAESDFVRNADIVIIATDQNLHHLARVPTMIDVWRALAPEARIYFFGMNRLPHDPPTLYMLNNGSADINQLLFGYDRTEHITLNAETARVAEAGGATYIDFYATLCDEEARLCRAVSDDGDLLYLDSNHWTFRGSEHYGNMIFEQLGLL